MKEPVIHTQDPSLDLLLEKTIDLPRQAIWEALTDPEQVKEWFAPRPWHTPVCEIDLRPGGLFRTVMRGPEGEEFDGQGCFLEVVEGSKLVWTSAMAPGYRPKTAGPDEFFFTAVFTLEDIDGGTKYSALVIHPDEETCKKHEGMGFHGGWGTAADQLFALVRNRIA